jgi:UV DNA damage endonuclease
MRFGLCCIFTKEPIKFRAATASALGKHPRPEQLRRLSAICLDNSRSLLQAVATVQRLGIGAFRVSTPLFPRYTHPQVGYTLDHLPDGTTIRIVLDEVKVLAERNGIRLSFHPDQFVSLSSERDDVVGKSLHELEYQGLLAELIGADVINIHAGGRQGGKAAALQRFADNFPRLSPRVQTRLTLENDDISYTVEDLLPLCRQLDIPLVYDVHHHRCNPDRFSVEEATNQALATWQERREPLFHVSSPKHGWAGKNTRQHADYINPVDFPTCWRDLAITVDVEAKAKELAIMQLMNDLGFRREMGRKISKILD